MGRKPTPEPDVKGMGWGCASALLVYVLAATLLAMKTGKDFFWVLLIPIGMIVGYKLYGFTIRTIASKLWNLRGIKGVLVYSNSPNWQEYIEEKWLPILGNQTNTLNWSNHKKWRKSLSVLLFKYYCGTYNNYNPSVIILRGTKTPLVFRFYYAFRDAKHGNREALNKLEQRLFEELKINAA
jgi:hypothetical protein